MKKLLVLIVLLTCIQTSQTALFRTDFPPLDFSSLKAIMVVGPQEDGTADAMEEMDLVAAFFKKKGVKIARFYDERAEWDKIKAVSHMAHFFVYAGHGSNLGSNGRTGGLCLQSKVSTRKLREEFQLADNALVIFQSVCGGAGSSASDDGDIGIQEAEERVTDYADPFFDLGAVGYYANNYSSGCLQFLQDFFAGKTMEECYRMNSIWGDIEFVKPYQHRKGKTIAITSSPGGGTSIRTTYTNGVKTVEEIPNAKGYEAAFVGPADFTVRDMLVAAP